MSLHFSAPHWPWLGPDDAGESARLAAINHPSAALHRDGGSMRTYAEMMTRLDMQVGRVIATLERLGLARDTVVVFTSDNGGDRFSKAWPFSGMKGELLEGGIRVPAIVRWPGATPPGSRSDAQIMSMDWLPTFLAAAGVRPADTHPLDGIDITPALRGGALAERPLFWRYKNHAQEAMRLGKWKYLAIAGHSYLFDLEADPMERANLKTRESERFAAMQATWTAWSETMLPYDSESSSHSSTAADLAERYGVEEGVLGR